MEIKYTYKEPDDRPIEKAEFMSSRRSKCVVTICGDEVRFDFEPQERSFGLRYFEPADFADFTALVNRINRQVNGVGA